MDRETLPTRLTQGVGDASLHAGRTDVADSVLVLWLDQHSYLDVPQRLHGDLGRGLGVTPALGWGTLDIPPAPRLHCSPCCWSQDSKVCYPFLLRGRRNSVFPQHEGLVRAPKRYAQGPEGKPVQLCSPGSPVRPGRLVRGGVRGGGDWTR